MIEIRYIISRIIKKIFCPPAVKNTKMGYNSFASEGALVVNCEFGKNSYVGQFTCIHSTIVGSFTSISSYCEIGAGMHPLTSLSSSPFFYDKDTKEFNETLIGNDVWIGSHVMIKSGVTISDGAVIGMGSVVTHDVGPYEIWAGNPAKLIRKRFDEKTIYILLNCRWWDWDEKLIKERFADMDNVQEFIRKYGDKV